MVEKFSEDLIGNSQGKPIVIAAFAPWNPESTNMRPIYEELAQELHHQYRFTDFDIDEFPKLRQHFKIKEKELPTFIFIKHDVEAGRAHGVMSFGDLKSYLVQYLEGIGL